MAHRGVLDFIRAGVRFGFREDGRDTYASKDPQLLAEVREEVKRRALLIRERAPERGSWPVIRLFRGEPRRSGQCLTCGELMEDHYSGSCTLCNAALREALKEAGKL